RAAATAGTLAARRPERDARRVHGPAAGCVDALGLGSSLGRGRNPPPHGGIGLVHIGAGRPDPEAIRLRAFELSLGPDGGDDVDNWLRAERELSVEHGYDTVDRDLERLGISISRLPVEAGVVWRLSLPRGERVEEWEPGNHGLTPPAEIARLIE